MRSGDEASCPSRPVPLRPQPRPCPGPVYQLHPGDETHLDDRSRDQCMPLMKSYGFDIVFTSRSGPDGHAEFLYLLRWKDRPTQIAAWKAFLANPESIAIKKAAAARHGDLVDAVQDRSLDTLPCTPPPSQVP
jgi:hypothetical protein